MHSVPVEWLCLLVVDDDPTLSSCHQLTSYVDQVSAVIWMHIQMRILKLFVYIMVWLPYWRSFFFNSSFSLATSAIRSSDDSICVMHSKMYSPTLNMHDNHLTCNCSLWFCSASLSLAYSNCCTDWTRSNSLLKFQAAYITQGIHIQAYNNSLWVNKWLPTSSLQCEIVTSWGEYKGMNYNTVLLLFSLYTELQPLSMYMTIPLHNSQHTI